jgi:hypothetical protein
MWKYRYIWPIYRHNFRTARIFVKETLSNVEIWSFSHLNFCFEISVHIFFSTLKCSTGLAFMLRIVSAISYLCLKSLHSKTKFDQPFFSTILKPFLLLLLLYLFIYFNSMDVRPILSFSLLLYLVSFLHFF